METRQNFNSKKFTLPLLFALILILAAYTAYMFGFQKGGFHSDEVYSYGLSNSYYQPFLITPDGVDDFGSFDITYHTDSNTYTLDFSQSNFINCYTWTDGFTVSEYLSVQPEERFAYDSVLHNQRLDVHPPLYYLLLHTVCSFFPDSYSRWYAFSINLLCLIGTQIFLFLTARKLSRSDAVSLLVCLLYGAGTGGLSTFLFLRQYALETMLCMGFTYFAVRAASRSEEDSLKAYLSDLACAAATALLAFFTHYSAIAYIGCFTALYCLYLLFHKRIRKMFLFGGSLLGALIVFLALWPYLFRQTGSYDTGGTQFFSQWTQIKMLFRYFCRYCLGFSIRVLPSPFWRIALPLIGFGLFCFGMLLIPFRDETWCQNLIAKIKALPKRVLHAAKAATSPLLFIVPAALVLYPVTSYATNVPKMGKFVVRYILPSFPMLCMAVVLILHGILGRVPHVAKVKKPLLALGVAAALVSTNLNASSPFLMREFGDYEDVAELVAGKNVVVLSSTIADLFKSAHCVAPHVRTADQIYIGSADFLEYFANDIRNIDGDIDYVLIQYNALNPDGENAELAESLLQESISYNSQSYYVLNFLGIAEDLSEEDLAVLAAKMPEYFSDGSEDASNVSPDGSEDASGTSPDRSAIIRSFNGGCDYKILFGMNVQGILFYVLELS